MSDVTAATVADAMYALVKECHGKRQLKPLDLSKAMLEKFGERMRQDHVQGGHPHPRRGRALHLLVRRR